MLWHKKRYAQEVFAWDLAQKTARSAFLGTVAEHKEEAYLALDELTKHTIIAGATGGGKTVAGQILVEEAFTTGVAVVIIDPTAQWTGLLEPLSETTIKKLYKAFGLTTKPRGFPVAMTPLTETSVPSPEECFANQAIKVLLADKCEPAQFDAAVSKLIGQFFHTSLKESKEVRLLLVFDEIHRILPRYGGTGEGLIALERAVREFRKWGIGVLLISQVLEDFVGAIRANIGTQIQMHTSYEEDLARLELKYGKETELSVVRAEVGTGMFQNAEYNAGKPFFIRFRPPLHSLQGLPEGELKMYLNLASRLNAVQTKDEQRLLTLKLAQTALHKGEFPIVQSYLEELEGRR